jgi:hypothetical protein
MEQTTSTGPPCFGVQRGFETNRLASGFQARAYEEVVPVVHRSGIRGAEKTDVAQEQIKLVEQGGIAA